MDNEFYQTHIRTLRIIRRKGPREGLVFYHTNRDFYGPNESHLREKLEIEAALNQRGSSVSLKPKNALRAQEVIDFVLLAHYSALGTLEKYRTAA